MNYDYSAFADAFRTELIDLVLNLSKAPDELWGFAVMLGEDIDMLDCIAVTIRTTEIDALPHDYRDEAQFCPLKVGGLMRQCSAVCRCAKASPRHNSEL